MKKLLVAILFGMVSISHATVWNELKTQVWDETKVTIQKSGGVAGFYDASSPDLKLRAGVLSHVLTNRFLAASLGWYAGDNKEGVLVGGPTIKVNEIIKRLFPDTSEIVGEFVPPMIKPLDVGFNYGWGTDDTQHYGFHIMYNFGK